MVSSNTTNAKNISIIYTYIEMINFCFNATVNKLQRDTKHMLHTSWHYAFLPSLKYNTIFDADWENNLQNNLREVAETVYATNYT